MSRTLVALVLLAGCTAGDPHAGHDLAKGATADLAAPPDVATSPADFASATADLATPVVADLAKGAADLASSSADLAPHQCADDGDCRLYSSYCDTAPCVCIPLHKLDPDPPCKGKMVTCFADPCLKKKPFCHQKSGLCMAM